MKFILILCLLFVPASSALSSSNFSLVKLPKGVEVQVPNGWWFLGKDFKRIIDTSVEAAMDLSGFNYNDSNEVNLLAANSMPRTTYAMMRIDSTTHPALTEKELLNVTKSELRYFSLSTKNQLEKMLPYQGNKLLNYYGVNIERIGGHLAIIIRYRRSGPQGPVIVELNQIYTHNQMVRLILSYRESEKALWLAVIKKIRASIKVK